MTRAITVVRERRHIFGDLVATIRDVDVTSYTTGGEDIVAQDVGLKLRLDDLVLIGTEIITLRPVWLPATGKLKLIVSSTGLELGAGADGGTWRVLAIGK